MRIKIRKNGPYEVTGNVPLKEMKIGANRAGESVCWEEGRTFETGETYHLCRCGKSKNKPFATEAIHAALTERKRRTA